MELQTETFSNQLYHQAKTFFLQEGRSDILLKNPLSVCGRYLITQQIRKRWFPDFLPKDGIFQCGEWRYSTSHSGEKIFFALANEKIAVDIEKIVERTYHLKNPSISRETFYAQWCAKECVVKFLNLTLDTTEKMLTKKQSQQIIITYQDKEYPVQVRDKDGYTYAIFSGSKN